LGRPGQGEHDVAIVGGGLAGAALARALAGMRTVLLARKAPQPPPGELDARIYAISPGNAEFLAEIGAWSAIPRERLAPVHAMRVYGDDGRSSIEFDGWRSGAAELAWIVEESELQRALWRGIASRAAGECVRVEVRRDAAELRLAGGGALGARLVVGADGARSFVRAEAGIALRERPYGQTAVVANFSCARPHRGVALQWFRAGTVLALLPLPGERVSMVWSVADAEAARMLALEPGALCREVERAAGGALGELALVTAPRGFVLRRARAARMVAPRIALLGDAAHVIHPLAGQGANLGLQDARALAGVLAARESFRDPGDLRLLRRYERARAEPVAAMDSLVHGLQRLFGAGSPAAARLRNAGLNLVDRMPVVKNMLARHAMA
jgi:ubiquinone biosynthesis UbiH/UbiF/VisC/COQ6 family hydroxylase